MARARASPPPPKAPSTAAGCNRPQFTQSSSQAAPYQPRTLTLEAASNLKKQLYICTYNKKCNHLPRIETCSSTNTHNYVLLSRSFHRDKKSKPSRKNKNYRKAKRRKLDQKCQGTAAAGTWRKPSSAIKRNGCGSRNRLPRAT